MPGFFDAAWEEKADIVIADLPCSGLGVIGRKKDIKYKMTVEKEAELVALQREILKMQCVMSNRAEHFFTVPVRSIKRKMRKMSGGCQSSTRNWK